MRSRRLRSVGLAAALLLVSSFPVAAVEHFVSIDGTFFEPQDLIINTGDTVTWVNNDFMTHTATSGASCSANGIFSSPNLGPTATYSFTFQNVGDFRYFCVFHCLAGMRGTVTVEQAPTAVTPVPAAVLGQNFPNPFNPRTTIEYTLVGRSQATVSIYDAEGALVVRFDQGIREAGTYRVEWDGRDAAGANVGSGVYFYRLEGIAGVMPRKMVLLK